MGLLVLLGAIGMAASILGAQTVPKLPPDYQSRVTALERSRLERPQDLQVLDALAASYTMAGRYEEALGALREMQRLQGSDPALQLRVARNLSWAGQTKSAIESYRVYLRLKGNDRQATIELIRLRRYRGDYSEAEKLCNGLLKNDPDDSEVLALKAEVLHWAGNRQFLARRTAHHAAQVAADSPDAKVAQVYALRDLGQNREALRELALLRDLVARRGGVTAESSFGDAYRLLESELGRPLQLSAVPTYSVYNDSDGIHNLFSALQLATPVRHDHALFLGLKHYRSSVPLSSVFAAGRDTSHVNEFTAGGALRAAPGVSVTLLGGGSRRAGGTSVRPLFDFQVRASPVDRWTFDFSAGREFLKVTPRAIDRNISSYSLAGAARYAFDSRTSLGVHVDRHYWSDENRSIAGELALRRVLHYYKPFMVDAGVLSRWEKFDRDTRLASGFFTPDRYRRHDGFVGLHGELGRWFTYEVRGAAGAQQLARGADYRPSWELAGSTTFRLTRSLRLSAAYQRRNYSLLSAQGWYQGFYVSLGVQQ